MVLLSFHKLEIKWSGLQGYVGRLGLNIAYFETKNDKTIWNIHQY